MTSGDARDLQGCIEEGAALQMEFIMFAEVNGKCRYGNECTELQNASNNWRVYVATIDAAPENMVTSSPTSSPTYSPTTSPESSEEEGIQIHQIFNLYFQISG